MPYQNGDRMRGSKKLLLPVLAFAIAGCARHYDDTVYVPDPPSVSTPALPAVPSEQQIGEQVRAADAECNARYEQRRIKKATDAVKCFEQKLDRISEQNFHPLSDTDKLLLAKMYELAEKVDLKRLTKAEAKLKYAEYQMALNAQASAQAQVQLAAQTEREKAVREQSEMEAQARALELQTEAARRDAATRELLGAAAIFGAMAQPSRLPYGAYQLPNQGITCLQTGNLTTCQ